MIAVLVKYTNSGGKVMKRKVVKMGLALVMSAALLAGCGGSSEAENFKNDLKAFAE